MLARRSLVASELLIAGTLHAALRACAAARPRSEDEDRPHHRWLVREPLGLFAGWLTVATSAATTEAVIDAGVDDLPPGRAAWAVAVVATAGLAGATTARRIGGSVGYPAAVVWGLATLAQRRRREEPLVAAVAVVGSVLTARGGAVVRRARSTE